MNRLDDQLKALAADGAFSEEAATLLMARLENEPRPRTWRRREQATLAAFVAAITLSGAVTGALLAPGATERRGVVMPASQSGTIVALIGGR